MSEQEIELRTAADFASAEHRSDHLTKSNQLNDFFQSFFHTYMKTYMPVTLGNILPVICHHFLNMFCWKLLHCCSVGLRLERSLNRITVKKD
jgi:hypothetical protein